MRMIKLNRHTYWPAWFDGHYHPLWVHNSDIIAIEPRTFYSLVLLRGGHTIKVTDYPIAILNSLEAKP